MAHESNVVRSQRLSSTRQGCVCSTVHCRDARQFLKDALLKPNKKIGRNLNPCGKGMGNGTRKHSHVFGLVCGKPKVVGGIIPVVPRRIVHCGGFPEPLLMGMHSKFGVSTGTEPAEKFLWNISIQFSQAGTISPVRGRTVGVNRISETRDPPLMRVSAPWNSAQHPTRFPHAVLTSTPPRSSANACMIGVGWLTYRTLTEPVTLPVLASNTPTAAALLRPTSLASASRALVARFSAILKRRWPINLPQHRSPTVTTRPAAKSTIIP